MSVHHPVLVSVRHPVLVSVRHPVLVSVRHPVLVSVRHPVLVSVRHPVLSLTCVCTSPCPVTLTRLVERAHNRDRAVNTSSALLDH